MKYHHLTILALLSTLASTQAAVVFQDDFSDPDGTPIAGKASDIGNGWTQPGGPGVNVTGNALDTSGAARIIFGSWTGALAAGQQITFTYNTETVGGGNFFSGGYAGLSLYAGANERVFTGDVSSSTFWGVGGAATGGEVVSADNTQATQATYNYVFDTGAWTFTTTSGVALSGTATTGEAFDNFRIANDGGGDIKISNISVDISPIPEPTSALLLGLAACGFGLRRRR